MAREVRIPAGRVTLAGTFSPPAGGTGLGIVLFAHGSGSSRLSPRNRFVAEVLDKAGLGTLLFDLLTPAEDGDRSLVFDVDLLAERLLAATDWVVTDAASVADDGPPELPRIGYFGASTGAAAALVAAAQAAERGSPPIGAVVSRGGRPDLAGAALASVRTPTLLIVGSNDHPVLEWNRAARERLTTESRVEVVAGAGHLFEEPGTLARAAELARDWFVAHLGGRA